jgi:hypothetical protein
MTTPQKPLLSKGRQQMPITPTETVKTMPSSKSTIDADKVFNLVHELIELAPRLREENLADGDEMDARRMALQQITDDLEHTLSVFSAYFVAQRKEIRKNQLSMRIRTAKRQVRTQRLRKMKAKIANAIEGYASAMDSFNKRGEKDTSADELERANAAEELDKELAELDEMRKALK